MTPTDSTAAPAEQADRRTGLAAIWVPGLLVAVGAAVATAHGLYEVARAAGAPALIAGLYPLITDGLALVAYAATARLTDTARRYAWTVVVLAAGLSGLAQASYLADGVAAAPAALRFGVGAWPAIAAAIVAHLLFLLATDRPASVQRPAAVQIRVQPDIEPPHVQPVGRPDAALPPAPSNEDATVDTADPPDDSAAPTPNPPSAGARARRAARGHLARHGDLPTARRLAELADVSRGTAGEALKNLRDQPGQLHVVHPEDEARTNP